MFFLYNLDIWDSDNYIVLDFETTNYMKGDAIYEQNKLIYTSFYYKGNYYYIRDNILPAEFIDLCESVDFIVCHNAKFELKWLARNGLDLTKVVCWDTQIGEYVLRGNNQRIGVGLDDTADRYGVGSKNKLVSVLMKSQVPTEEIPRSILEKYCDDDVYMTHEIFKQQREKIKSNNLLRVFHTRNILTPVLADIESNGACVDTDRSEHIYNNLVNQKLLLSTKINKITGGINTNSPKQLAEFLYETMKFPIPKDSRGNEKRTPSGNLPTDADTIKNLKASNKKQREFVSLYKEYNEVNNLLSKVFEKLHAMEEDGKNILYADFNQTVTQTHRLSSSGKEYKIQFQNFPRELKPLFTARYEGWMVGEADQAQLEFRVAAFLGDDDQAKEDIQNNFDVHKFSASEMNGVNMEEVNKAQRQEAKADTFKPLYGGESGTPAQRKYYEAFKKRYKGIAATQQEWIKEVLSSKQLRIPSGLIFYWPSTKMQRSGYVVNRESICNYPVQSFATADIVPIAVVHQWHRMKQNSMRSFIVNTVHDSSISEVAPEEQELYKEITEQSFTNDVYNYLSHVYGLDFDVELEAEVEFSHHWAEFDDSFKEKWLYE